MSFNGNAFHGTNRRICDLLGRAERSFTLAEKKQNSKSAFKARDLPQPSPRFSTLFLCRETHLSNTFQDISISVTRIGSACKSAGKYSCRHCETILLPIMKQSSNRRHSFFCVLLSPLSPGLEIERITTARRKIFFYRIGKNF